MTEINKILIYICELQNRKHIMDELQMLTSDIQNETDTIIVTLPEIDKTFMKKPSRVELKTLAIEKAVKDNTLANLTAAEKAAYLTKNKINANKTVADKAATDKVATDKVAADKLIADKAGKAAADKAAKVATDKLAADKLAADKLAADKLAADKAAKAAADKLATEMAAADKAAKATADKAAKAAADKLATEMAAADKAAKATADKLAADKLAADRADKAAADKLAADKLAADKAAKATADKLAAADRADKAAAEKVTTNMAPIEKVTSPPILEKVDTENIIQLCSTTPMIPIPVINMTGNLGNTLKWMSREVAKCGIKLTKWSDFKDGQAFCAIAALLYTKKYGHDNGIMNKCKSFGNTDADYTKRNDYAFDELDKLQIPKLLDGEDIIHVQDSKSIYTYLMQINRVYEQKGGSTYYNKYVKYKNKHRKYKQIK